MSDLNTRDSINEIPYGYCHCGCGQKTRIPTKNIEKDRQKKGVPLRYLPGHQNGKHNLSDAFWQYVTLGRGHECWEWQGPTSSNGYGRVSFRNRHFGAHRISYQLHYGVIPNGLYVCHHCDNRACVNPLHLYAGTHAHNTKDMVTRERQAQGEQHGCAKLTEMDVMRIRSLYGTGIRQIAIAREYGISQTQVSDIVRRKSWKHI